MKIYHYTDASGLMGIIKNRTLWATDINFLNDSEEYHAGLKKLKDFCNNALNNLDQENPIEISMRGLLELMPNFIETNLKNRNLYIISFTSKEDNLRQWMSYCPENSGYCIEFDSESILMSEENQKALKINCKIENVDYNYGRIDEILSLKYIINLTETLGTHAAGTKIAYDLLFHCCAIKNNEFHDESETRLVIQSKRSKDHETQYRTKSGIILPYIEYPINTSAISKIIVGPNINIELAKKGLEDFLLKNKVECNLEMSRCSLRVF